MKLQQFNDMDGKEVYFFECPGCKHGHVVHVRPHKNRNGASWEFDRNFESPSFSPSFLQTIQSGNAELPDSVCHLFVKNGQLEFLSDCTHTLAGQTVPMSEIEEAIAQCQS